MVDQIIDDNSVRNFYDGSSPPVLQWQDAVGNLLGTLTAGTIPDLTGVAASATYTEGGSAIVLSPTGLTVADAGSTLTSATVSVGFNSITGDVLAANTSGTSITATYDTAAFTLTLNGTDTLAHYQQVLRTVAYSSTSQNPTDFYSLKNNRVIHWIIGNGTNFSSREATFVNITPVNNAPILTGAGILPSVVYTPWTGTGPTPIVALTDPPVGAAGSVTITDPDNLLMRRATVTITNPHTGDGLYTTNLGSKSWAYDWNATTFTLTIFASDASMSLATTIPTRAEKRWLEYVMSFCNYYSTSLDPTNGGTTPSRTLQWQVTDSELATSNIITSTITFPSIGTTPTFPLMLALRLRLHS